ncbi:MAG: hypothetical protein LJE67_13870 [Salaquimonas sp.]|jgi:hypothetical protein|nr:hypothetical protein [Salaquimonas sp.]
MKVRSITLALAVAGAAISYGGIAQAKNLFFEGDMVRGHTQDGATGPSCVLTSEYKRQESVVWRVRVLDDAGQNVDDKGIKSLVVQLGDGETFEMGFGQHPRGKHTDAFWATSWRIPEDFPTGSIGYKVVATDLDGTTHEWEPFNVAPSKLTVIEGDVTFTK